MSVERVLRLSPETLAPSVPDPASYLSPSAGWEETEYLAPLPKDRVEGGYWRGEPGSVGFAAWPYTEICVILRGSVGVEDESGAMVTFGAGESFLIPEGFSGRWHTLEPTEKIFLGVHGAPAPE